MRGKPAREEYGKSQREEKRRKGLKSLEPMIKMALADKVLTYDEKTMIYQEGIREGLNISDIDSLIKTIMEETGGVKDETVVVNQKPINNSEKGESLKYCEICGNKIDAGALFCGECGNRINVTQYSAPKLSEDNSMKTGSRIPDIRQEVETLSEMVFVSGGTFQMGSNNGGQYEKPIHRVTLSDFLIDKYEVTQGLWKSVMGNNPSNFTRDDNLPVEKVTWYEAVEFCNKLNEKEGLQKVYSGWGNNITMNMDANGYRLPTEAEWEYAAKGGSLSKGYEYSGSNNAGDVAWYSSNSDSRTRPVGQKQPNELGIYDMSGNVWEWCWDWYRKYSSDSQTNPTGPSSGSYRVRRGGSWYDNAGYLRPANRDFYNPDSRFNALGFRLLRTK